jgi:phosphatidate cytidylyltransferase
MLKTRVITAVILLAVLLAVLFGGWYPAFAATVIAFLFVAIMECFQLFKTTPKQSAIVAAFWSAAFAYTFLVRSNPSLQFWFGLSVAIWLIRFVPALKTGLPPAEGFRNSLLGSVYALSIIGCFAAIIYFFGHGPVYLLSVMALVWIADIGAYFSGKAFGKRKLAPSISPGKSWEGAIGGGIAVLVLGCLSVQFGGDAFNQTFAVRVQHTYGWPVLAVVLVLMTAASIVGDLFESQLKRRAGMKDSSNLLPGHGGVLDRIDSVVAALPVFAIAKAWLGL